ncbi:hypothetical protein ACPRNU_10920 [Chromobacterium vaccinii]|uniref:hypothetical protein n=1 Tax=Chromobacterium TaxID=535 RepID=UPI0013051A60|nr:hypothetical protein [Chromobacterium sp. ATCC 53434]
MASIFILSRHLLRDMLGDEHLHHSSMLSPDMPYPCQASRSADERRRQLECGLDRLRLEKAGTC